VGTTLPPLLRLAGEIMAEAGEEKRTRGEPNGMPSMCPNNRVPYMKNVQALSWKPGVPTLNQRVSSPRLNVVAHSLVSE